MLGRLLWTVSLCLFLATDASAQLASQTALVGTVTDSDGLVVPGARVVAVNVGTRDTYETTTNAEGYYTIQFVHTGTYEITVSISGFRTFTASGVEVGTNQVVRTNAVLQVGGMNESVNVVAAAHVLDTDSARISETIGPRAVVDLPIKGRNVWSLASTTPGVLGGLNSDIGLSFTSRITRTLPRGWARLIVSARKRLWDATTRELIKCFDSTAFALPAQFTFGNAPRNLLRGPKFATTDLSLMKNVPLAKTVQFQIRAEIFNAFNEVNYNNPNGVFGSAACGRISSAQRA